MRNPLRLARPPATAHFRLVASLRQGGASHEKIDSGPNGGSHKLERMADDPQERASCFRLGRPGMLIGVS
jgi:hypothetical protein